MRVVEVIRTLLFPTALAWMNVAGAASPTSPPVIPGAVGFGINTPAGRGGQVIHVTTLADRGPGSLRAAVRAQGPRVVVFDLSGTITLDSTLQVENPNLTIAGQTAPAPGVTVAGHTLVVAASDVLIQHIALRPGGQGVCDPCNRDALGIEAHQPGETTRNVIIDHVSASWSMDEMVSLWGSRGDVQDVTIRYCLFGEPLRNYSEGKDARTYGPLIGRNASRVAFLNNVVAFAQSRNPLVRDDVTDVVIVNNFIYRPGTYATNKIDFGSAGSRNVPLRASVEGNVIVARPDDANAYAVSINDKVASDTRIYLADNRIYSPRAARGAGAWLPESGDPWDPRMVLLKGRSVASVRANSRPIWVPGLTVLRDDIEATVLRQAGARPRERDTVDARIMGEIRERRGTFLDHAEKGRGIVGLDLGLKATLRTVLVPKDADADSDGDGYTNLEEWLQEKATQLQ